MRLGIATTILMGLMFVAACNDPAADQPKATTGAATQASPQQNVAGTKYTITEQNSKIEFVGSKVTGSHNGSFQKFSGEINYAGAPERGRVTVTIDTNSLTSDDPKLTEHLKSADFFDVAKFPTAKFTSTEIRPGGQGGTHTIVGNLTLHGVEKSVTFPATINVTPDVANVDASFSINRKDFGINYAGAQDNLIRDDVVLKLTIRAAKA